jgi:molybdopterin-guanine dinucleotide biosynthesis protein A
MTGEPGVTSIVLAGGRSSRLGRDKSQEFIGERTLLGLIVEGLSSVSEDILIVISRRQSVSSFSGFARARTVVDIHPDKGPLGGLYTGLAYSASFRNFAVACDMPFVNLGLLRYMIGLSSGFDAVMPRVDGRKEPLHAIYTKDCLQPLLGQIREGNLRIADFPELVRSRYLEKEAIRDFDPEFLSLFNVNTQDDLDRARILASQSIPQEAWL